VLQPQLLTLRIVTAAGAQDVRRIWLPPATSVGVPQATDTP